MRLSANARLAVAEAGSHATCQSPTDWPTVVNVCSAVAVDRLHSDQIVDVHTLALAETTLFGRNRFRGEEWSKERGRV
jgi:hypothetical protein